MRVPAGCGVVAGWVPRLCSSAPLPSHQSIFSVCGLVTLGPVRLSSLHALNSHASCHLHVGSHVLKTQQGTGLSPLYTFLCTLSSFLLALCSSSPHPSFSHLLFKNKEQWGLSGGRGGGTVTVHSHLLLCPLPPSSQSICEDCSRLPGAY